LLSPCSFVQCLRLSVLCSYMLVTAGCFLGIVPVP